MKTLYKNIKIPALKDSLIKDSELFSYIDSDFTIYGASELVEESKEIENIEVYELTENMTLKEMFTNPEKQAMTQGQILHFIENNKDKLREGGCATFFLFKSNGQFFVARVGFHGGGSLDVHVFRFDDDYVYNASYRLRVVAPATDTETLSSETLSSSDSCSLTRAEDPVLNPINKAEQDAINLLKAQGFTITRKEISIKEY